MFLPKVYCRVVGGEDHFHSLSFIINLLLHAHRPLACKWSVRDDRLSCSLLSERERWPSELLPAPCSLLSPDWRQEEWPSSGPSTLSMLKGSPQCRHMMTRRSGLPSPPSPRGGAMLNTPDTRCLMLSTSARRLSSITAPSLISSQSSSRKGHWRESARFWPSSRSLRLSFSDRLVSGWKRMTRGKPCNTTKSFHVEQNLQQYAQSLTYNYSGAITIRYWS